MRNIKRKEYESKWREENREQYLESRKRYYEKNKEKIRAEMRKYYKEVRQPDRKLNREKYKEIDRLWAGKRREKFRKLFLDIKKEMGNKCSDCGYSQYPQILHFHHLHSKSGNISEMKSITKIKEEAKKCILLCPNCHMVLTFVKNKNV